jgi:predicted ATPase/DNA-binding SARP family transcriptional activator
VTSRVELRLLGPVELVDENGAQVDLPAGKPRALLALLALDAGRAVTVDRIVDGLWGEHAPATAPKVVQGYVSRLRKLLPAGTLETRGTGYALRLGERIDLVRFEHMRAEARTAAGDGRWEAASRLLAEALGLWRGSPLADVADELWLPGELPRLEELRLATLEDRLDADLELGREGVVVAELEAQSRAHPLRERFRFQLMLALYRLGRQAEALEVYRETRQLLTEELGIEPGPELQRLERQILVQDETLAPVARQERLPAFPVPLTPLVGRLHELAQVSEMLRRPHCRLVTLTGPGGVGKTRLAVAAAEPWGAAVLVPLAPVQDPGFVGSAIAEALGLSDASSLAKWLRGRELLLVLDNFEHVLEAAPIVTELLAAAPQLRVLATSREPLNVHGERVYTVAPLSEADAVDLFVERAAAAGADVDETDAVHQICRRLDCLPLAVELAAARARMLPPLQLLPRLAQRLEVLTGGRRDVPERQRTLRATIEWSYALLGPEEQSVFARLAVLPGGATLEIAEDVCGASLETLGSLVDKSLVQPDIDRFTMLETIREFAGERLAAKGEAAAVTLRLAEHLRSLAEAFTAGRERGDVVPLAPLESEIDNIRAAIRAALESDAAVALRLASSLSWFCLSSGRYAEGLRWTTQALGRARRAPERDRAAGLHAASILAIAVGEPVAARSYGDEALALHRAAGEDREVADLLRFLATAHLDSGDPDGARTLHAESVEVNERLENPLNAARALRGWGEDELAMDDPVRAGELLERSLALSREAGGTNDISFTLHDLADVSLARGDPGRAAGLYLEAIELNADWISLTHCLGGLAAVAAFQRREELAGRLWGAVEAHQQQVGDQPMTRRNEMRYLAALAEVAGDAFESARVAGRRVSLEEAVREARAAFGSSAPRAL